MIFKQVFDEKSSTYTYLIASSKGREALIIDPVLENVDNYIKLLNDLDLKLVKVIDTHIHADHVTAATKLKNITKCSTIMGEHTPAETVEIKVKDDDYINLDNKGIIENKKGTMHVEGMLSNSHNIKNEIGAKFNVGKESTRTTNKEHNTTITGIYSKEKSTFDNFGTFNAGGKDVNSTDTTSDFHPVKMWGDAQAKFYNHSTLAGGGKINKGANMSDFVKIINSVGQENIKNFTNLKDLFAKA